MTDKKSNENRRKLLKSIATSTGVVVAGKSLPESWIKPVVGSVTLPAHADTSSTALPTISSPAACPGPDTFSPPDIFFIASNTSTGAFTTRIAISSTPGDNISISYLDDTTWGFGVNTNRGEWSSATNIGSHPYGAFTSILTNYAIPRESFTLNVIVDLCEPNTVNVSGLTIIPNP